MADTPIAAAPAAPIAEAEPLTLGELTPEQRDAWRTSGEVPERPAPEPVAVTPIPEPEPAKVEPAPPVPVSKRQQQINDLIRERVAAEQRAQELEQRLKALEKPSEPAAPAVDPNDPEPAPDKFDTYEAYVKAQARWEARQERKTWEAERQAVEGRQAIAQKISAFGAKCAEFAETHPDFGAKAQPFLDRVTLGTPIGDVLADSPVGPQLALHLAEHPEEADRIARLHPYTQLRELGKLEQTFASTSASAGPAPARVITTAPAPVPTLDQRPAAALDDADDAVATGDFRRFREAANQKELARRR